MDTNLATASVYTNNSQLDQIKLAAKQDEKGALKQVAKQFETVFLQMVLKSMRQANEAFKSDLSNSDQMNFYQDMFDQQLSSSLGGKGFGIAEMLEKQLSGANNVHDTLADRLAVVNHQQQHNEKVPSATQPVQALTHTNSPTKTQFDNPRDFVKYLWEQSKTAAKKLGLKPDVLLAQAALETGWGKKISQDGQGASSHNLFNIKADSSWKKDKVVVNTLEYKAGVAAKQQDHFRKYQSFEESFSDYVNFLTTNPRYQQALNQVADAKSYLSELQAAGYATDPNYADKILNIIQSKGFQSMINGLR